MREINLFQIYRKISEKEIRLIRGAKVASLILLIFYCLLVTGFFSYWLILRRQNEVVNSKIQSQKQRINELKEVETMQTFVQQRLSSLSPILTQEAVDYKKILTQMESLIPEGVVISKIGIDQEGRLLLTGTASNAVVLADFLERLLVKGDNELEPGLNYLLAVVKKMALIVLAYL